jgi:hypothetical protein
VDQLGPNALGETLEPGRVADCYLGLLLPPRPAGEPEAGTAVVVAPAALLHPGVSQPAGSLVYALLTGHPEREPGELVFVVDLTCELRASPKDTRAKVGVDPEQVAQAVIGCWQASEVTGLQVDDLSFEEGPLAHPAGDDLSPRPVDRPARPRLPALAPSDQRPPPRRPVPVAVLPRHRPWRMRRAVRGVRNPGQ